MKKENSEEIKVDENELLEQLTKDIVDNRDYIQIKVTQQLISPDVLAEFGKKVSIVDKKGRRAFRFGDFMDKVDKYMHDNTEFKPIFNMNGRNVSHMDRMVILAYARKVIDIEMQETYEELMKNCVLGEEDDE